MGRVPKEKRTVCDSVTEGKIWWGDINIKMTEEAFNTNKQRVMDYFNTRERIFVIDGWGGHDPLYKLKVRVICTRPYHALFMKQMLIRPSQQSITNDFKNGPDLLILNGGEFAADPNTPSHTSNTAVSVNYEKGEIAILGTHYAGEMKKGLFGVMHYLMP
jgi:phosphoenolpyruvate carboxykinase (ATP)